MEQRHKTYQSHYRFDLKNNFYKVKKYFFGQLAWFSPSFF